MNSHPDEIFGTVNSDSNLVKARISSEFTCSHIHCSHTYSNSLIPIYQAVHARFQKLLLSLRINMKISKDTYWIIDFDSTFVRVECMPELARISLASNPDKDKIVKEIEMITDMGMNGEISFKESLSRRVKLLHANKSHVDDLVMRLKDQISLSVSKQREFIKNNNQSIYVITGGFKEFVLPVVSEFGISKNIS